MSWSALRAPSRRIWLLVVGLAVVLLATTLIVRGRADTRGVGLAGTAAVTASSTALGSLPRNVAVPGSAAPVAHWVSNDETVGAWIQLRWNQPHVLHRIVIERNPLTGPGIQAGFLTFGDGSSLQVQLSSTSAKTAVPITPRSVDSVRFTVSAVTDGARDVTVVEFSASDQPGPDDVSSDADPAGNVAPLAAVRQDPAAGGSDPDSVRDGTGNKPGAPWTVARPAGAWVELEWERPREVASVELVGDAESTDTVRSGSITFSDGTRLVVGAVLSDPTRPTIISFMPRVTTSVRLTLDGADGTGSVSLGELRVYRQGTTPVRSPNTPEPTEPAVPACGTAASASAQVGVVVQCPTSGTMVGDETTLQLSLAPGYTSVLAVVWAADPAAPVGPGVSATSGPDGSARLALDLSSLPAGPFIVRLEARGPRKTTRTVSFQLYRQGGESGDVQSAVQARGRTLAYAEEFNRPVAISRTGADADYAAAKPVSGGVEDFGDAIFADPDRFDNIRVVDDRYLRIGVEPVPTGYPDPQGWNRTRLGGLLASARPGGSGFSAQYGYFEARMYAPATNGTWPAFWMLPTPNLVAPQPVVAEIDAVELYGHNPTAACHTTHEYRDGDSGGVARCGSRWDTERAALAWHTFGVQISPVDVTYFIDGRQVATAPQVGGGGDPLFFLVDLALGGGWPVQLESVQDRAELYVDHIRVYV